MADDSKIEWTDATWNPVIGCTKVSDGCDNCYAETLVNRFAGRNKGFPNTFDVVTVRAGKLDLPIRWRSPKRIFVNSLSDVFHDKLHDDYIARIFAVMAVTPRHTYQVLTKRHARLRALMTDEVFWQRVLQHVMEWRKDKRVGVRDASYLQVDGGGLVQVVRPLPNVWLGVSVEDQRWADTRIPYLLQTPAAVRFLSCEPLLGFVHLDPAWLDGIGWVIAGGESGRGYRTVDAEWVRLLRNECVTAGVPFLFKQWGGVTSKAGGRELDGQTWDEYPQISSTEPTML